MILPRLQNFRRGPLLVLVPLPRWWLWHQSPVGGPLFQRVRIWYPGSGVTATISTEASLTARWVYQTSCQLLDYCRLTRKGGLS